MGGWSLSPSLVIWVRVAISIPSLSNGELCRHVATPVLLLYFSAPPLPPRLNYAMCHTKTKIMFSPASLCVIAGDREMR